MGEWKHESTDINWLGAHSAVKANGTSNLQMEGIIITNSCGWTLPIYNSDNLTFSNQFRNLKLVSGFWVNVTNHVIDDYFIFNNDDLFMSHGAANCKISNIVAWSGPWGRLYWLSNQTSTSGILFDNINVIGKDGGVALVLVDGTTGTNLSAKDVTFRNIRIEAHPKTSNYNTNKFILLNSSYKTIRNWVFENIIIDDKNSDEGDLYGTANSILMGLRLKT